MLSINVNDPAMSENIDDCHIFTISLGEYQLKPKFQIYFVHNGVLKVTIRCGKIQCEWYVDASLSLDSIISKIKSMNTNQTYPYILVIYNVFYGICPLQNLER